MVVMMISSDLVVARGFRKPICMQYVKYQCQTEKMGEKTLIVHYYVGGGGYIADEGRGTNLAYFRVDNQSFRY